MPLEAQLSHRVFKDLNLPYVTNNSPTSTDPFFGSGSNDILTTIAGYAQRRPGFADNVETTPTTFVNLQRLFAWDRFDGSFFIMACDLGADNTAKVYKYQVGVDTSFSLIYTEASATGVPYDFVVSNNTIYFGNGFYVKKWNPTIGVENWGISIGSITSNVPLGLPSTKTAGAGTNDSTGLDAWINPNNVTSTTNYAVVTISAGYSDLLVANQFGFSVGSSAIITGIVVTCEAVCSAGIVPTLFATLTGPVGGSAYKTNSVPTSNTTLTFGGSADLWSTSPSYSNINDTTFGVSFQTTSSTFGQTISVRNVQITIYGTGGNTIQLVSGSLTATVGYQYVQTYGNSVTGHISSPTPPSNSVKPSSEKMLIPITASSDSQVDLIHTYRTTDSATGLGGQSYFEIPTSPVANSVATVTVTASSLTSNVATFTAANNLNTSMYVTISGSTHDAAFNVGPVAVASASSTQFTVAITHADIPNAADAAVVQVYIVDNATDLQLNIYSVAPTPTFNDPPPPIQGMVYFAGRIWGFAQNKVYFSGLEEITVGVPEESFPSGVAGNFWSFDEPVNGLGVAGIGDSQILGVFCGGRVYGISGNTLDTFRRFLISNRRGARNRTCISMMGGMCAWLDSANQVWASNGSDIMELSVPIRPDLLSIDQTTSCLSFHTAGNYHWLVLSTGEQLFVYDIDTEQWMPPWTFACKYLFSGETSAGNYNLMAATTTKAIQLSTSTYNDNGVTYQPEIVTNLMSLIDDQPSRTEVPWYVEIDTNNTTLADVGYVVDDDPSTSTFTTIFANKQEPEVTWNRTSLGVNIVQQIFPVNGPVSRWFGLKITLQDADQLDKLYGMFVAFKQLGSK